MQSQSYVDICLISRTSISSGSLSEGVSVATATDSKTVRQGWAAEETEDGYSGCHTEEYWPPRIESDRWRRTAAVTNSTFTSSRSGSADD